DDELVTTLDTPSTLAVLANDEDADDDPLILLFATEPAHGSATVEADGSITYFPDPGYAGLDAFDYGISEGAGDTELGHVAVKVTLVNHAPTPVADALVMDEDTIGMLDPTANDTDEEGGALVVSELTQPAHGSAALYGDGTVGYTPAGDYSGPDTFGYTVTDGAGASSFGLVSVAVGAVNDAPVAADDFATTPEDTSINVVVAANDSDVDSGGLGAVAIAQSGAGSAVIEADGAITYTPRANYVGVDSLSYVVSDGEGGTDTATLWIWVSPPSTRPGSAGPRF
ncbi:MAG: cadherin-like domain-containing protein, partial [Chloroflexota bacterium]|nr:cadherin-like domain-containing protein [Chloroflexota bacterium]